MVKVKGQGLRSKRTEDRVQGQCFMLMFKVKKDRRPRFKVLFKVNDQGQKRRK